MTRTPIAILLALLAAASLWLLRSSLHQEDAPDRRSPSPTRVEAAAAEPEVLDEDPGALEGVAERTSAGPVEAAPPMDPTLGPGRARLVLRVFANGVPQPGCVVRVPGREDVRVEVEGELIGAIAVTDQEGSVRLQGPAGETIPFELAPFGLDVYERWSMTLPPEGQTRDQTILVTPTGIDWFDLLVVDAGTGEALPGADVRVKVAGAASTTFDASSGPNGVARIPAPRHGELTVSKAGYAERFLLLDIPETPPTTTIGLSRTASLHGRIPVKYVEDYQIIEVSYDSRGKAPVADKGLSDFARPPRGGGIGSAGNGQLKTAKGRVDVRGNWTVEGLEVSPGSARVWVFHAVLRGESDAEALDDDSVIVSSGSPFDGDRAWFACDLKVAPGERVELPFPSDPAVLMIHRSLNVAPGERSRPRPRPAAPRESEDSR